MSGDGFRIGRWFRFRELLWAGWRLARKAFLTALPVRAHVGIAKLRGWAYGRVLGIPEYVIQNIQSTVIGQHLGRSEIRRIARRNVEFHKSRYIGKSLPRLPSFNNPHRWPVHGLDYLDSALQLNRGVMLVTAHFGYVNSIAPILRVHGYDILRVTAASKYLNRDLKQERWLSKGSELRRFVLSRTGVFRNHPKEALATLDVRPILSALLQNQAILIAADGMRALQFAQVGFLNRIFPFPTGFMKIALITKAPVLPIFAIEGCRRNPIVIEIEPPLPLHPDAPMSENIRQFARVLEVQLRKNPHLWPRWRVKNLFERALSWTSSDLQKRYNDSWWQQSLQEAASLRGPTTE